jgi:Galactose oxidase, central domain
MINIIVSISFVSLASTSIQRWNTENWPSPVIGHTLNHLKLTDEAILIGGWPWTDDINRTIVYDINECKWKYKPVIGSVPSQRHYHSATELPGSQLIIFGGIKAGLYLSDVHLFNSIDYSWVEVLPSCQDCPLGRYGHSATLVSDDRLIVFGGNSVQGALDEVVYLNILELEPINMQWEKIQTASQPSGRFHHTGTTNNGKLFV